ncbi:endonuclease/exonuclease/phosphatase family protein, partial [Gardnerella vaginalis]
LLFVISLKSYTPYWAVRLRQQIQEHFPVFVYQSSKNGNKRGNRCPCLLPKTPKKGTNVGKYSRASIRK